MYLKGEMKRYNMLYKDAKTLHEQSLAQKRIVLADQHPLVANSLVAIGLLNVDMGHLQEADRRFTDAFEMRKSIYGEENYYTSLVMIQQGLSTRLLGKYTQSIATLNDAINLQEKLKLMNECSDLQIAESKYMLGMTYKELLKLDDSRKNLTAALSSFKSTYLSDDKNIKDTDATHHISRPR